MAKRICSCDFATVVQLLSFQAEGLQTSNEVLITWSTVSEIDNAGFHIWRSETKDGLYSKITQALIPAEGGPTSGGTYGYTDPDVSPPQVWYYKLEDIDNTGASTFHGPVLGVVGDAAVKEVDGSSTIDDGDTAPGIGEISVEGTGSHTITTGRYGNNPESTPTFTPTGDYWFVDVSNPDSLNRLTIHFCPAQAGDNVYSWNGSSWLSCSQQQYQNGCIEVSATVSGDPRISDFNMLIFAMGRGSAAIPTLSEWGFMLLSMLLIIVTFGIMRRRKIRLST